LYVNCNIFVGKSIIHQYYTFSPFCCQTYQLFCRTSEEQTLGDDEQTINVRVINRAEVELQR